MTRRSHHEEHPQKPRRNAGGHHPLRKRLFVGTLVLAVAVAGAVFMFDRKDLPAQLKDNAYVAKVYKERDAAIEATSALIDRHAKKPEAPDANAEMKQQGYNKDDRAKLEAIINNGGKAE